METVKEVDQDGAEESEENGLAEEDVSYMVGLLQDMSDEYSMKEQDPCDLYDSSDWDEAVSNHTLPYSLLDQLYMSRFL